jgi:hypothetical protein
VSVELLHPEIAEAAEGRPSMLYVPGRACSIEGEPIADIDNGQLQFHSAPHVIRMMAPGNGFGKSASMAVEADWWGHADHPYLVDIPKGRKRQIIWCALKHQQYELVRNKVEQWWPRSVVNSWIGAPRYQYTWPDGTTLTIVTGETDWRTIQGFEPDLVLIDEHIDAPLWREFIKRRRGATRTKYAIAATQTQGLTWMHKEIYVPWKRYHESIGITDEREMMRRQLHRWADPALKDTPGIWCLPLGGHRDNPTATAETWAFYLATTTGHAAERAVRLYGGFREFAGMPVFDPDALEAMRAKLRPGLVGQVVWKDDVLPVRIG